MPIHNTWIIRALAARLRQPTVRPQRRFMVAISLLIALFVLGTLIYLFRQPTEDAMERAAIKVFAVMGIFTAIVIAAAVVVRKKTGVSWSRDEALKMAGETRERQRQPKR